MTVYVHVKAAMLLFCFSGERRHRISFTFDETFFAPRCLWSLFIIGQCVEGYVTSLDYI